MESCNTLTYNKTVLGEGERKEERKDPGKPGGTVYQGLVNWGFTIFCFIINFKFKMTMITFDST